jgi:ATP-dependent RNA helicase DDX10/DBP4
VLEILRQERWGQQDGLGALIITPTRELALQLFDVLRKIGYKHPFSAGLIIGGKNIKEEQEKIARMNILIATPGRLLQHLDQTPNFQTDSLKLLVLDEADKILEMGFAKTMNAILEALPKERQTLLFSATQTNSVKDLARLSLKDPVTITIRDKDSKTEGQHVLADMIPRTLSQYYMVCPLERKLDWLYSFIRTHLKCKIIVFLSSCKQVRFYEEAFCKLQPGMPIISLHGKQNQFKRIALFKDYCRKIAAVLFCTDLAARGLDFPKVDWVIQLDCPDSVQTYIHRAGRTARNDLSGFSLLFLCPSEEEAMIALLSEKSISVEAIEPNLAKIQSIQPKLAAICSQYPAIKYLGQKAAQCYMRSVFVHPNKSIFDINAYDVEAYCISMGLPTAPTMHFHRKTSSKNMSRDLLKETRPELLVKKTESVLPSKIAFNDDDGISEKSGFQGGSFKYQNSSYSQDSDEDILQIKKSGLHSDMIEEAKVAPKALPKKLLQKKLLRGQISNEHLLFDEEADDTTGRPHYEFETEQKLKEKLKREKCDIELSAESLLATKRQDHLVSLKHILNEADIEDKLLAKKRKQEKKFKVKAKSQSQSSSVDTTLSLEDAESLVLKYL